MNLWIAIPTLVLTYAGIALCIWPVRRVNRTTLTVSGAGLLLAAEILIVGLLAALLITGGVMEESGITLALMNGILHPWVRGGAAGLSLNTVALSNLVSNVPAGRCPPQGEWPCGVL